MTVTVKQNRQLAVACVLIGLLTLTGCGNTDSGELYRAERDFFRARRAATALRLNTEIVGQEDHLRVAKHFRAVGDRYFGVVSDADADMASDQKRLTARLGAHAYLASSQFFVQADEPEQSLDAVKKVRDSMKWSPDDARAAQVRVIETTQSLGQIEETIYELWRLAEEWPAVTSDGSAVHFAVLNAPMNAVRVRQSMREPAAISAAIDRALVYYDGVRATWPLEFPAFLADLHRATLIDAEGDWKGAAGVLEATLDEYPDVVMSPEERGQVAYRLGRIYHQDNRDMERADHFLVMAAEVAPEADTAFDAKLFHGAMMADLGQTDQAIQLYREVQTGRPSDKERAPIARFRLARLLQESDRWDEAVIEYRGLQSAFPGSPQAMEVPLVLAMFYREKGEPDLSASILSDAETSYRDVIDRQPGTPDAFAAYRYLFQSLAARQNWPSAVEAMESFADTYQGRAEAAEALIEAARIASQLLADEGRAGQLLMRVEETYPNTRYAELASRLRVGG